MSRRNRILTIGVVLVLLGAELGLRAIRLPEACLRIVNEGLEPIVDLRAVCDGNEAHVVRIDPGESSTVYLRGRGDRELKLTFRQRGNATPGFVLPGFDSRSLSNQNLVLVLSLRNNQIQRYQDELEPSTWSRRIAEARKWLEDSLKLD